MYWCSEVCLGSWASDATATAERVMPWLDSLAQVSPLLADWKLLGKSRYECLVARPLTLDTLRVRLWEGRYGTRRPAYGSLSIFLCMRVRGRG